MHLGCVGRGVSPQRCRLRAGAAVDRTRWDAVWFSCEGGLDTASALLSGFFDIVDLDEGTCGRRLAVSGVIEASVDRFKAKSFSYVLHVSIRNGWLLRFSDCDGCLEEICAERLLDMSWLARAFHLGWLVT